MFYTLKILMKALGGAIPVTFGVLGVSWWNFVRYNLVYIDSFIFFGLATKTNLGIFGCQGEALFQTHENMEHLAMMEKVLGLIPQHMLKRAE